MRRPGRVLFQGALANFNRHSPLKVDFKNDDRAPLLLIGGGEDHTVPAVVDESTAKHYRKSAAVTEYKEFRGRSHYTIGQQGWEEAPSSRRSAMAHSHGGEKAESGAARSLQTDPRCHQGDPGQHDDLIHESARLGLIQMG
jgi:dienelactone hydrolase